MEAESEVAGTTATATTKTLLPHTRCMVCGSVQGSEPICHFTAENLSISGETLAKDGNGDVIEDISVHIRCGMMAQYKGKPKYEIQNVRGVYNKHRHDPLYQAAIKRTRKTMAVTAVVASDGPTSGSSPSLKDEREFCLVSEFADSMRRLESELMNNKEASVGEKMRKNLIRKKKPRKNSISSGHGSSQKRKRRHFCTDDSDPADGGDQEGAGGGRNIDRLASPARHRKERSMVEEALTYYKSQRTEDRGSARAAATEASDEAQDTRAASFQSAATTAKTGASWGSSLVAGVLPAGPAAKISKRESDRVGRIPSPDNNISISSASKNGESVAKEQLALKDQEISVLRRLLDRAIEEKRILEQAMARRENNPGEHDV